MMKAKLVSGVTTIVIRGTYSRFQPGSIITRDDIPAEVFDSLVERSKITQPQNTGPAPDGSAPLKKAKK